MVPDNVTETQQKTKKTLGGKSGAKQPLVRTLLSIGIEVDPTAGAETGAQFALGSPGRGHDPLSGFSATELFNSSELKQAGNLYFKGLAASTLKGKTIRVRSYKSGLLMKYDEGTGKTSFRDTPYQTAELLAEMHLFMDDNCLTGTEDFEKLKEQMKKETKTGINRILIRLNKNGSSLQDCIIDGVIYVEGGTQKVNTDR